MISPNSRELLFWKRVAVENGQELRLKAGDRAQGETRLAATGLWKAPGVDTVGVFFWQVG
jgi:hypothetical protein